MSYWKDGNAREIELWKSWPNRIIKILADENDGGLDKIRNGVNPGTSQCMKMELLGARIRITQMHDRLSQSQSSLSII